MFAQQFAELRYVAETVPFTERSARGAWISVRQQRLEVTAHAY